ncbi:hypothetical protein DP117_23470 [Brasilonema sp. UFV-L1]|nr:hypothetical protein [Brasilonema sp. UFV-L1]
MFFVSTQEFQQLCCFNKREHPNACKNTWRIEFARQVLQVGHCPPNALAWLYRQSLPPQARCISPCLADLVCIAPDFQSEGNLHIWDAPQQKLEQMRVYLTQTLSEYEVTSANFG